MVNKFMQKKQEKALIHYGKHQTEWNLCELCEMSRYANHHVFGRGDIPCDILFISEAPGKVENLRGEAFIGKAFRYFMACIQKAKPVGLRLYFSNLVACRPCDHRGDRDRPPTLIEIQNCRPRLVELYKICTPISIIFVGDSAQDHVPWEISHHKIQLLTHHPDWFLQVGVKLTNPVAMRYIAELAQFFTITRNAKREDRHAHQTPQERHPSTPQ